MQVNCKTFDFSIYPSPEQDPNVHSIPISSNTGSLPDLSNLHFPSPLVTPLDPADEQSQYAAALASVAAAVPGVAGQGGNLSPTVGHHMGQQQTSPGDRRRGASGAPSPLVLQGAVQAGQHITPVQVGGMVACQLRRLALWHK